MWWWTGGVVWCLYGMVAPKVSRGPPRQRLLYGSLLVPFYFSFPGGGGVRRKEVGVAPDSPAPALSWCSTGTVLTCVSPPTSPPLPRRCFSLSRLRGHGSLRARVPQPSRLEEEKTFRSLVELSRRRCGFASKHRKSSCAWRCEVVGLPSLSFTDGSVQYPCGCVVTRYEAAPIKRAARAATASLFPTQCATVSCVCVRGLTGFPPSPPS